LKLYNISFNNLWRRKGKLVFLVFGLVIGIATIVTLLSITESMSMDIEERLDKFGANIVMTPKNENLPLSYGGISLGVVNYTVTEFDETSLADIKTIKNSRNLGIIAPKVLGPISLRGRDVLLMGVDFKKERKLKAFWQFKGKFPVRPDEIAIGSQVASAFKLATRDTLLISNRVYTISGILLETGSSEDSVILVDLHEGQKILGKEGKITMVEVAAFCRGCPITEMTLQLAEKFPNARITTMKQAVMSKMQSIDMVKSFGLGVTVLVICIGVLLVFTTMMGSVNERTREIGIFRAIGFRRGHVMQIILLEAMIVGLLAGLIGFFGGSGIALSALPFVVKGGTFAGPNGLIGGISILASISLSLVASLYPAIKASRLDPSEALRSI
jgi:putative ABC transport system permease protein